MAAAGQMRGERPRIKLLTMQKKTSLLKNKHYHPTLLIPDFGRKSERAWGDLKRSKGRHNTLAEEMLATEWEG